MIWNHLIYCIQKLDFDSCSSNPCRYNGNCTNIGPNAYNCTCEPGFTSTNCETGRKCNDYQKEFSTSKVMLLIIWYD